MSKLRLMKVTDEILAEYQEYYGKYEGKVYVYLGEFAHAPGHILLCEFGNGWNISGMHERDYWEFIDQHPGDVVITMPIEDEDMAR